MVQGSSDRSVPVWEANTNPEDMDIVYKDDWGPPDRNECYTKNYVIELRIPKSALGISTEEGGVLNLLATQSCTNDIITAEFEYTSIPEFPTVALPVCAILGLFYVFSGRRRDEE